MFFQILGFERCLKKIREREIRYVYCGDQYHPPGLVQTDELLNNFKKPFFYIDKAFAVQLFNVPKLNMQC